MLTLLTKRTWLIYLASLRSKKRLFVLSLTPYLTSTKVRIILAYA